MGPGELKVMTYALGVIRRTGKQLGFAGTVLGLIRGFGILSAGGAAGQKEIMAAMAVALFTTFYGIILSGGARELLEVLNPQTATGAREA